MSLSLRYASKVAATASLPDTFREFQCGCGERALLVRLRSGPIVVKADPIVPRHRCPQCLNLKGQGKNWLRGCPRCNGTGWIGERIPDETVAISVEGKVRRRLNDATWRYRVIREGEALHARHECEVIAGYGLARAG